MINSNRLEHICRFKITANAKLLLLYIELNPHDKDLSKAHKVLCVSKRTIDRAIVMLKAKKIIPYNSYR